MIEIRSRESVILTTNFSVMVEWYRDILGFRVNKRFDDEFHYCNLETPSGIEIGIASAEEMGVVPANRLNNTVVLQFEVDDVKNSLNI